ncbi:molybdopterin-dependent oxidoreductase [Catelliglobosispora koreensis]|uniref:molybdopterin-dependent oxidoreductase n=1 Tax=Catelliglobosispora koreensis TaxID=129052 RepID=UPI0003AA5C63|nr:molybdopterin-dependent oxidoreductase [Catelliglobosispora koreensis]
MRLRYAVTGVIAAAGGLAAAELAAALTRPEASPLVTIGGSVIDATPTPVKEFAVRTFGTADKPLLLSAIVAGVIAAAAIIGLLARRRRKLAIVAMAGFGLIGALAALTRPASAPFDIVPALLAGAVAAALLAFLTRHRTAELPPALPEPGALSAADPEALHASPHALSDADAEVLHADPPAAGQHPEASRATDLEALVAVGKAGSAGPHDAMGRAALGAGAGAGADGGVGAGGGTGARAAVRRREVLIAGAGVAGIALLGKGIGTWKGRSVSSAVTLPVAADPAKTRITTPGFYTANKDFYRVDTALTVPRVAVDRWQLTIRGNVPLTLSFEDLIRLPLIERDITLNCVSNEVGGPYIGTARWLGVPLASLLKQAGIPAGADQIVARSTEGMTIGTPVETVLDGRDAMIAIGMNGEPLPPEHGFPARMLTPGLYGYAGACKWIAELELSTFDTFDAYWVRRGWAARAPVKTASRIDRPAPFAKLAPGQVAVAGVAWAQQRGIAKVEIQVDDGPWAQATLMPVPSADTWVQWTFAWNATAGGHSLRVRATDARGDVQTPDRQPPFPDGATGWHTVAVTVA